MIEKFPHSIKKDAESYLMARAWFETVEPIVSEYQKNILSELGAKDDQGKDITDSKFLFSVEDQSIVPVFLKRCDEEAAKNKLAHKPDCCPMLEAEFMMLQAKHQLIKSVLSHMFDGEITEDQVLGHYRDEQGHLVEDPHHQYRYVTWGDKLLEMVMPVIIQQFNINGKKILSSLKMKKEME